MSELLGGDRFDEWVVDAITPTGDLIGRFAYVEESGHHSWSPDKPHPIEAGFTIGPAMLDGAPLPDWATTWIRITYINDGVPRVVATLITTDAPEVLDGPSRLVDIAALDTSWLLGRAKLRTNLTLAAGTPVAEKVRALIGTYAPLAVAVIGDTDETLRDDLTWSAGTALIEVVNALLEAAGYTNLRPTPEGVLVSQRWVPPALRPILPGFSGTSAPFVPEMRLERDLLPPTEVIAVTPGSQASEAIVARWPEYQVANPITDTIHIEATSVEAATLLARQHFESAQQLARRTTIKGPWQPVAPGRVMPLTWAEHQVDGVWELTDVRCEWSPGPSTSYPMREVIL